MTPNELKQTCKKYANVYLPCEAYSSALWYYQLVFSCDHETARKAIGLQTGGEIANILFHE